MSEKKERYICSICGYIYDPEEHSNIPFVEQPEFWVCPICSVEKDMFDKIED